MKTTLTCVLWLAAAVAWWNEYRDIAVFLGLGGVFMLLSKDSGSSIEIGIGGDSGGGCGGD